ncbi:MAG: hypothetical protein M3Q34_00510 [bacterium]|nr:hypothetical protein [bacterium]
MKNLLAILLVACTTLCSSQNKALMDKKINKLTLHEFGSDTFWTTCPLNIGAAKVTGMSHGDGRTSSSMTPTSEKFCGSFFGAYLRITKTPAKNIFLAIESGNKYNPGLKMGVRYTIDAPRGLMTKSLFDLGIRNFILSDTREKSRYLEVYQIARSLFRNKGGETRIYGVDSLGYPNFVVTKEPEFTKADSVWLRDVWYKSCYKQDLVFEKYLYEVVSNPNTVGIVGALHAYHLNQKYGLDIVLAITKPELEFVMYTQKINEVYLEASGIKKE